MEYPVADATPQVEFPKKEEPIVEEFIPSIGLLGVSETTEAPASDDVQENADGPDTADEQDIVDEPATISETMTIAAPETRNEPETDSEPETLSESETDSEPETKSGPKTDSEQETVAEPETDNEPDTDIEPETDEEAADDSPSKTPWILAAVVACVLSFAAGYFIGRSSGNGDQSLAQQEGHLAADTTKTDSAKVSVVKSGAAQTDSLKGDTTATAELDEKQKGAPDAPAVPNASAKPVAPVAPVAPPATSATSASSATTASASTTESDKYAQMDARVRTGAYRIVGTDYQVTVRAGETTARIARRTLGPDMECYIEVYNGIKGNSELKAGQKLNIPKLQWKKKKKTVNN